MHIKTLHMNLNSLTHNGHKLETNQMSNHQWMDEHIVEYPYHWTLLSDNVEATTDTCDITDE